MSNLIHLNEIVPTKSNIDQVASALIANVQEGSISPAEFAVKAKFLKDVLDKALKEVNQSLCDEVGYAKDFTCLGAKIEPAETGVKYDYSQDAVWAEINAQIAPLEDLRKAQEERIKIATKIGHSVIDETTGEVLARPVTKTSTTSVKITLAK